MSKYRAYFYDKNTGETRSITVEADNVFQAEKIACQEADNECWSSSFCLGDIKKIREKAAK